jgi:hypothetical protein
MKGIKNKEREQKEKKERKKKEKHFPIIWVAFKRVIKKKKRFPPTKSRKETMSRSIPISIVVYGIIQSKLI